MELGRQLCPTWTEEAGVPGLVGVEAVAAFPVSAVGTGAGWGQSVCFVAGENVRVGAGFWWGMTVDVGSTQVVVASEFDQRPGHGGCRIHLVWQCVQQ